MQLPLGRAGLEGLIATQGSDVLINVEPEACRHPPRLGHDKHGLRQLCAVALLQGPQLFGAHVKPFGLVVEADALRLARLRQAQAETLQFRDQLGIHGQDSGNGHDTCCVPALCLCPEGAAGIPAQHNNRPAVFCFDWGRDVAQPDLFGEIKLQGLPLPAWQIGIKLKHRLNGRYWIRTSDPFRVKEVRYRCANRPIL
jgi:hypothetical protein